MTTSYANILERGSRFKKLLAISATALVLGAAMATPSWAAVKEGRTIEVFHGIDYAAIHGYPANTDVKVDVLRGPDNVVIGSTTQSTDGTGFLEINHVGGGQAPAGDCWGPDPNVTPNILPGDTIRTTVVDDPTDVDTSAVRDVIIDTEATTVDTGANTITMKGHVRSLPNAPIDLAADIVELRMNAAGFTWETSGRRDLREDVVAADFNDGDADPTTFTHVFNVSDADANNADANGFDQAIEWSGAAAGEGLPPELTVFDGLSGALAGCGPLGNYAVTGSNHFPITAANVGQDLVISGSSFDANNVEVTLSDGAGGTLVQNAAPVPATGGQSWSVTFLAADVGGLAEGTLTASGVYTMATGDITGENLSIKKDTILPAVSDVNLADVSDLGELNNDDLTNDNTPTLNGTAEAGSTVKVFDGATQLGQTTADSSNNWGITVPADKALSDGAHSIKATATDGVGNSAESATALGVTIDTQSAVVNASPQSGLFNTAQNVTLSLTNPTQEVDTKIYFTLDGSTPQAIASQLYSGPISIAQSRTLKYRSLDKAGNLSSTGAQTYRIDTIAPRIIASSKTPKPNATRVGLAANVKASFSENVTRVSGATFKLRQGKTFIPAKVTYSASTRTAVLNPNANLARGKKYTVVLNSGIRDSAGNRLTKTSWSFTTR